MSSENQILSLSPEISAALSCCGCRRSISAKQLHSNNLARLSRAEAIALNGSVPERHPNAARLHSQVQALTPSRYIPRVLPSTSAHERLCVGDKVRITLSDGSRVCAADLPAEFEARTWEQNVGWTCGHARKWANPTQPIVRIATILGRSIRVSPNHRFWTPFGWTPASHLKVGDSLAIARGNPAGVSSMALDRAWTIGVLIGDVELSRRIRRYFPEHTPMLVTEPGQEGFRLDCQTIPPECFTWDAERIGAFVAGVLEACGAILDNESGRKIVFAHPSSRLIEGLQALLLVLKAVGRIRGKMYFREGRPDVAWRLSVCGSSLVALTAVLDSRGRRARNLKSLPPRQAWDSADLIPPSLLEHFGSHLHRGTARRPKLGYQRENLLRHVPRDTPLSRNLELAWDAVTSITQEQAERTWAIEVENAPCLIANDFLTRDSP